VFSELDQWKNNKSFYRYDINYAHRCKEKGETNITYDDQEWIERIGKTAYKIYNKLDRNQVELDDLHPDGISRENCYFCKFHQIIDQN
jgi:hypothetical protein